MSHHGHPPPGPSANTGPGPSVPIITLNGLVSPTDVLQELPVPSPSHPSDSRSLLFMPEIVDETRNALVSRDPNLAAHLAGLLCQADTADIQLEQPDGQLAQLQGGDMPEILQEVLTQNPAVFRGGNRISGGPTLADPVRQQHRRGDHRHMADPVPMSASSSSPYHPVPAPSSSPFHTAPAPLPPPTYEEREAFSGRESGNGLSEVHSAFHQLPQQQTQTQPQQQTKPAHHVNSQPDEHKFHPPDSNKRGQATDHQREQHQQLAEEEDQPMLVPVERTNMVVPDHEEKKARPRCKADGLGKMGKIGKIKISKTGGAVVKLTDVGKLTEQQIPQESVDDCSGRSYNADSKWVKEERQHDQGEDSSTVSMPTLKIKRILDVQPGEAVTIHPSNPIKLKIRLPKLGPNSPDSEEGVFTSEINHHHSKHKKKRKDSSSHREETGEERHKRKKHKKHKHHHHHHKKNKEVELDAELDTTALRRFGIIMENIIESRRKLKVKGGDLSSKSLCSRLLLSDFCTESSKLKASGATSTVSADKLKELLNVVHFNIYDGKKALDKVKPSGYEDIVRDGHVMEQVLSGLDAALGALYIITSLGMAHKVFLEEVITDSVELARLMLSKIVCPQFDPVYRHTTKESESSMRQKRARAGAVKSKSVILLYNKLCDLMSCFAELVEKQPLIDELVLSVSALGVKPFFVENVSELQLSSIRLVTAVFCRYDKHRQLIIAEILSSLTRLPSSKSSIRTFRIQGSESIQMFTALMLQLLQSVVKIPKPDRSSTEKEMSDADEIIIITSYESSCRLGRGFLSAFLKKCSTKGEEDYRALFENFIEDLLVTVNTPEWPAAELLLSILGRLLVNQFTAKSTELSLRVASLDYLGIVASRLRKDTIESGVDLGELEEIVAEMDQERMEAAGEDGSAKTKSWENPRLRNQLLQKALIEYLAYNGDRDNSLLFARNFFLAQWYHGVGVDTERRIKSSKANRSMMKDDEWEENGGDEEEEAAIAKLKKSAEKNKTFLMSEMGKAVGGNISGRHYFSSQTLTYESAALVTRHLTAKRPFSQSFDSYLNQILKVLGETSVPVRSKAMKCLTLVIEVDPSILARRDVEQHVSGRFQDQSTLVREAAVDLVGKFVLIKPELANQYYNMLAARILDTGVSVRRRVIKIFRDICTDQPDFPKIPEMCVRMLRRVNDEENIKKLVTDVFQSMWFTPLPASSASAGAAAVPNSDQRVLLQRVQNITAVIALINESTLKFVEELMKHLLKKTDGSVRGTKKAYRQIVDCLVEYMPRMEKITVAASKGTQSTSPKLVAYLSTLYLFAKVRPKVMIAHGEVIHPYIQIECNSQQDNLVVDYAARILELTIPLMEHPSETFLSKLEADLMKLVLKHRNMVTLQSCVGCLGAVVNQVTRNYKLVADCFLKFFNEVLAYKNFQMKGADTSLLCKGKPYLLRALFVVGVLCKSFDLDDEKFKSFMVINVEEAVLGLLHYFLNRQQAMAIQQKALTALGFYAVRYEKCMLSTDVQNIYRYTLTRKDVDVQLKCLVLKNLQDYLAETEEKTDKAESEWKKQGASENLKEMGDVQAGTSTAIIQVYLSEVLESYFDSDRTLRVAVHNLSQLIYEQGFIPVQLVPYLICMSTDCEQNVRIKAENLLQDINKKYSGFIHNKSMMGMRMSYRLQRAIQPSETPIRGMRSEECVVSALNQALFSIIRSNRQNRRALLTNLLNLFDDSSKTSLGELIYVADNLAYFPYQVQDEPLFIMHQIDLTVSVSGSNLLQIFREGLLPRPHSHSRSPSPSPALKKGPHSHSRSPSPVSGKDLALTTNSHSMAHGLAPGDLMGGGDKVKGDGSTSVSEHSMGAGNTLRDRSLDPNSTFPPIVTSTLGAGDGIGLLPTGLPPGANSSADLNSGVSGIVPSSLDSSGGPVLPPSHPVSLGDGTSTPPLSLPSGAGVSCDTALLDGLTMCKIVLPRLSASDLRRRERERRAKLMDEEEEDFGSLLDRVPSDGTKLQEIMRLSQGCTLLLVIKQHLKDTYNINDSKIQNYSPTESAKVWDKPLTRRPNPGAGPQGGPKFEPQQALQLLSQGSPSEYLSEENKAQLVRDYLDFKLLMDSIDPAEEEEEEKAAAGVGGGDGPRPLTPATISDHHQQPVVSGDDSLTPSKLESTTGAGSTQHPVGGSAVGPPATSSYVPSHYLLKTPQSSSSSAKKDKGSHRKHHTPTTSSTAKSKKKKRGRTNRINSSDDSEEDPDFVA